MEPKPGQLYRHYKGNTYRILTLAQNNEADELYRMVVYVDANNPDKVWAQSVARFKETVVRDGEPQPRFTLLSEQ